MSRVEEEVAWGVRGAVVKWWRGGGGGVRTSFLPDSNASRYGSSGGLTTPPADRQRWREEKGG